MKTSELRKAFLDYFKAHDHQVVASSPLVPGNDPTLLFTNAGMVQFKDVFTGREKRSYARAASSQRCVRAGGKHNDLENVGYTARHHTFFEMLGNFSFGDYFKREAISYAWEFITRELSISPERLWVTVYQDDDEAADIWLNEIGVDPSRFGRLGKDCNFWAMGETGPCGPCTEIFYDHGPEVEGGPPGSPDQDGDRYVEIWNLVFMQFDRAADGNLSDLPKPSVDTGMGLERIAAVMQGVHSNYDIDLFRHLVRSAADVAGVDDLDHPSLRVIADHIRACAFLITDGVLPGNEGRGYVLRRIVRRALRHGYELGVEEPFFYRLVQPLDEEMGQAFPELTKARSHVEKVLRNEEERFAETLSQGMSILEQALEDIQGKELPGELVFRLYDTYGFPADLTADVARNHGMTVDQAGFDEAMGQQRARARAASRFNADTNGTIQVDVRTDFAGYEGLECEAKIVALFREGQPVECLDTGEKGQVILDRTSFYAESGGQVGDTGQINGIDARFAVEDTRNSDQAHVHIGTMETGKLLVGDKVIAQVNPGRRAATVLNHSATHLMHAALRQVLGDHVTQKGSLVAPERLRFDFSHYEAMTTNELDEVERLVNEQIRKNAPSETQLMSYDQAIESGAMALFGEKYGEKVRVLKIGDSSIELCGGTHVNRAGDIGLFKIVSESGIAAGIRRIEAVTGEVAREWLHENELLLDRVAELVRGSRVDVEDKVRGLLERNRTLEKELQQVRSRLAAGSGEMDLSAGATDVGGVKVLVSRLDDGVDARTLRETVDRMKDRLGTGVVVLGTTTEDGKVRLAAGVTRDTTDRIRAGDVVNEVAEKVGGRGGGRPDFAQAGGSDPGALDQALESTSQWIASQLMET